MDTLFRKSSWLLRAAGVSFAVLSSGGALAQSNPCATSNVPPGAQALGYTRQVFCVMPRTSDVAQDDGKVSKLYSGQWYARTPPPASLYSMNNNLLTLSPGGGVSSQTRHSQVGALPLLPAAQGFYIEFAEQLSDNDPDHFPAVWAMPQEHNGQHADHAPSDPAGIERWMELDVDEGGYNNGHHGTVINWWGTYPNYQHHNLDNAPAATANLDRTQEHIFGLSYDPVGKQVTWWVDGSSAGSVSTAEVPAIVNTYHYYVLINNQNHGKNKPYTMSIRYFSAWSGSAAPNAPSGVKATTNR